PRATGLLQVVGRRLRRQARAQDTFAGQVEVPRMLEYRPGHHLAKPLAVEVEALNQPLQGTGQHLLVAGRGVDGIGTGEGNAVATDDGDATQLGHDDSLLIDCAGPGARRIPRGHRLTPAARAPKVVCALPDTA